MRAARVIALFCVLFLLVLSLPAAAQVAPRVPPTNDNIGNKKIVRLPFTETLANIGDATTQAGEAELPCIGAVGSLSVWYIVYVPVGITLVVDTTASNYDTVIGVWTAARDSNLTTADVTNNVACENDGGDAARLNYQVPAAGFYIINVSAAVAPVSTPSLTVAFDAEVPAALQPKGGSLADAAPLKLNDRTTLRNVEYSINHDPIVAGPSCAPTRDSYPVWFKFTLTRPLQLTFSSEGSLIHDSDVQTTSNMVIGVFPEVFDDTDDDIACDDDSGFGTAAYVGPITLSAGSYYLRVTSAPQNRNAMFPSRIKITTRVTATENLLVNSGFEDGDPLNGWTVKSGSGDAPSTDDPLSGARSFKFVGGPGEKSKLRQNISLSPAIPVDEDYQLLVSTETEGSAAQMPFFVTTTLIYANGSTQKVKRRILTNETALTPTSQQFRIIPSQKKPLSNIKFEIKFSETSGTLQLDDFQITFNSVVGREAGGVLPPPPPPAQ